MGKLDAAADNLRAAAEQFRPLIEVADALKDMGSLEQAMKERQDGLQTATAIHEDLKAQTVITNDNLKELRATYASEVIAHQAAAQEMEDEAQKQALAIVEAAKVDAERVRTDAAEQAAAVQQASDDALKLATAKLDLINTQVSEAENALVTATAALDDTSAQIATLRQLAQKIV